ncbi:MAG TPA: ATP-binding protein [Candidatus Nanopelagicales bacterium]
MSSPAGVAPPIRRVVVTTAVLGALASAALVVLSLTVWSGFVPTLPSAGIGPAQSFVMIVVLTSIGQFAYVRVRHEDAWEELNFFEVVLAVAILLLAPAMALIATLTGMLVAELLIRRGEWVKVTYNLGNYAASTAAMIATYHTLLGIFGSRQFWTAPQSFASMVSLVVSAAVFTGINGILLADLLRAASGAPLLSTLREGRVLSVLMAISSVGMGFMAVALAFSAPAAMPFVLLPALALWYAYGEAAQRAEAHERNDSLVTLGSVLAQQASTDHLLTDAAAAIRLVMGAPEVATIPDVSATLGPELERRVASTLATATTPRPLTPRELPQGWHSGAVTRMDLGGGRFGAILLGTTEPRHRGGILRRGRGWELQESDQGVLGALVAAVGSAMRAGAAFEALKEETAKLSAVVNNTSDGIAMVDGSGAVRLWSHTMERMTGVSAATLAEPRGALPPVARSIIDAASPESSPVHVHLVRGDGEELDISLSTVRVRQATSEDAPSAGWARILTAHDETRERRVDRLKNEFVANVSHELRTPITPIKGYAHLLATRGDRITPEKRAQAAKIISELADRLSRLVDDLLLTSLKSENNRLDIDMGVEDVATLIAEAVAGYPALAARSTVSLPEEPLLVACDRIRAVQCLTNLLGNAEKYASPDGVEVTVREAGRRIAIHVRDHGPGIPAAEQERVFERFYRREDPFTMEHGGAGLGLAIARELAQAMGGRLWLRTPADGTGAEFILELLRATEDGTVPNDTAHTRAGARPPGPPGGSMGSPDNRLVAS